MTVSTHLSQADIAGYTSDERFLLISLWILDAHKRGMTWPHITKATGLCRGRIRSTLRTLRSIPESSFEIQGKKIQRTINRFAADFALPMRVRRPYTDLQVFKSRSRYAWILWDKTDDARLRRLYSTIAEPVA